MSIKVLFLLQRWFEGWLYLISTTIRRLHYIGWRKIENYRGNLWLHSGEVAALVGFQGKSNFADQFQVVQGLCSVILWCKCVKIAFVASLNKIWRLFFTKVHRKRFSPAINSLPNFPWLTSLIYIMRGQNARLLAALWQDNSIVNNLSFLWLEISVGYINIESNNNLETSGIVKL